MFPGAIGPRGVIPVLAAFAATLFAGLGGAEAGYNELPTILRMRDIVPGTEQVTLIPHGDFEAGEEGWTHHKGWSALSIGEPVVPVPPCCGSKVLRCDVPMQEGKGSAAKESVPLRFEANTEYVFSAYIWVLGDDENHIDHLAVGIQGEQHIHFVWPTGSRGKGFSEGFFIFGSFRPYKSQLQEDAKPRISVKAGDWKGKPTHGYKDKDGQFRGVAVMWDNIGLTRASEFAPPVLKGAATREFQALLRSDLGAAPNQDLQVLENSAQQTPVPVELRKRLAHAYLAQRPPRYDAAVGQLEAAVIADPKDFRLRNALAAACMVAFLEDTRRPECCDRALLHWDASLKVDPAQADVQWRMKLWRSYRAASKPATSQPAGEVTTKPAATSSSLGLGIPPEVTGGPGLPADGRGPRPIAFGRCRQTEVKGIAVVWPTRY